MKQFKIFPLLLLLSPPKLSYLTPKGSDLASKPEEGEEEEYKSEEQGRTQLSNYGHFPTISFNMMSALSCGKEIYC